MSDRIEGNIRPLSGEIEGNISMPTGGDKNIIESISLNGIAQEVDDNKNVNLTVQEFNIITYNVTTYSELQTMYQNKKPTFIQIGTSGYFPVQSIEIEEQGQPFIIHIPVVTTVDGSRLTTNIIIVDSNNRWNMMPFARSIPFAVSELTNDSGYQTAQDVASAIANKADRSELPTKVSDLANDAGYQTSSDVQSAIAGKADRSEIPTAVSDLTNDSGYQTAGDVQGAIAGKADRSELPTKTSDLTNDSGFITSASVPTEVSQLTNDSGFQTASDVQSALAGYATETYVQNYVNSLDATEVAY